MQCCVLRRVQLADGALHDQARMGLEIHVGELKLFQAELE